jgi:ribosomal protein S18 acetylase RimI-like enzyme
MNGVKHTYPDGRKTNGMADELSIRRYESDDAEAVWAVHERALRASPIDFVENVPGDEDLRAIPEEYLDADGEFLVGTVSGEVVAIGGYQPTGDGAAELRRMRVHPDHQRNGYGETLLTRLETLAAERGFDRVVLETNENLTAARTLYQTRGYEQFETATHPESGEQVVRYRKEL